MSDMKTILENWRTAVLHEGTETVGDLIKVIKQVKLAKAAGKGTKVIAKLATMGLEDVADFIDAALDAGDLAQGLYGGDLSDKKQPPALQAIAIDPDVSRIVADDIERSFLTFLSGELQRMPPETPINNVNTTKMLQDFIASKFNNKTVKGA